MIRCAKCGKVYNTNVAPLNCNCGTVTSSEGVIVPKIATDPKRFLWVKLIRMLRKPEDVGVGDTVKRIADKFGGERFKAFAEKIGIPCGCVERQATWNARHPY